MSDWFIGEIRLLPYYAAHNFPSGWAECNGQLLSIPSNEALFSVIGTTYGGDGRTTFALPDLRGRVPVGAGAGPGLTPRTQGQHLGTETVTLNESELPPHTHAFRAFHGDATSATPEGATVAKGAKPTYAEASGGEAVPMHENMLANEGGSQPHDNMSPSMTLRYFIAVTGIYPARS